MFASRHFQYHKRMLVALFTFAPFGWSFTLERAKHSIQLGAGVDIQTGWRYSNMPIYKPKSADSNSDGLQQKYEKIKNGFCIQIDRFEYCFYWILGQNNNKWLEKKLL